MLETPIAGKSSETRSVRESPRVLRLVLVLLLFAIVIGAVIVWGIDARIKTAAAVKQETQDLATPTVAVAHPKLGALENEVVLPGNIQAFMDAPVSARASGYVKKWYADIGTHVKAGQILADIDAPELDQQVRQAQAAVQQAKAALDQTLANLEQQGKANAELARVSAQRWSNLVAKGVVSRQENDQYQAQYQAQMANVAALEKGNRGGEKQCRFRGSKSFATARDLQKLPNRQGALRRRDHRQKYRCRRAGDRRQRRERRRNFSTSHPSPGCACL